MSIFFPILASNKIYKTSTIVYNFPPNNFQNVKICSRFLSLIWIQENIWRTKTIYKLKPNESKEVFYDSIRPKNAKNNFLIMSITDEPLNPMINCLPKITLPETVPAWRSTICVHRKDSIASYQGEIMPFPQKSTLLSFSTFLQQKEYINNYLIFMNLESKPISRLGSLKFSTVNNPKEIIQEVKVKSNNYNFIDLNNINIENNEIMICHSENISGIPLFLSYSEKNNLISLEHTHPPSSLVIYENRNKFQKIIKRRWFEILKK